MAARHHRQPLAPGARAPEFSLSRLDGAESTLQDLIADGPILLAFFKISCPVCQLTFPYLERLKMPVFGVSQNDEDDTRWFNSEFGVTFPTLLDREENDFAVSSAFSISSVPTLFLVERDGSISRTIEGWVKADMESLGVTFHQSDNVPAWKAG